MNGEILTKIDVSKLSASDAYKLLIGTIVPRPIAWVSTISAAGISNLAPFSFFNGICGNPPSLLFCPLNQADGSEKDTLRNIRETQQFVVNIADESLAAEMNQSSGDYAFGVSEFQEVGLEEASCIKVKAPRVARSPASFECELIQAVQVGPGGQGSAHVVIGKIVYAHFAEGVFEGGHVILERLKPIARLAGRSYCPVREVFDLPRPKIPK
jgi:flavin reductase (DIM6/NTAB) family NADH-FMN oxidoreductase RutF